MLYVYKYDQLNRLTHQNAFKGLNTSTNVWTPVSINSGDYNETVSYDGNGNILSYNRNGNTVSGSNAMDALTYAYNYSNGKLVNNKLRYVNDGVSGSNYGGADLQTQGGTPSQAASADNYKYDPIGNLISDTQAGISNIDWTVYGKIQKIYKSAGNIDYTYNTAGQRVSKTTGGLTTWYVRDAQGNPLAIYDNASSTINWREQDLYGSSRLGTWAPGDWGTTGNKTYELSNHLGNVLATITDRRLQVANTAGTAVDHYTADVASANDYYPFGMLQPVRQFMAGSANYRYGFNGKENDNEVKGVGNQQDYGMRIYDPRVGRFLSVDPITAKYPELTPYQFASNTPIRAVDIDGLESGWNQIIPQSVWAGSGIYQPNSEDQAREWMWKFIGMYTGSLAKVMGMAAGGPEKEGVVVVGEQVVENAPKIIEAISEVKIFESTAASAAKALKPAEVATELKKVKTITNLGDLYRKVATQINDYMMHKAAHELTKAAGAFGNAKGTLFEIKAAETLPGVYKVNETVKVTTESAGLVKQQIDLFRNVNGETFFSQLKAGDFSTTSFSNFLKDNLKQIQRTILTAGYSGATPEFIFQEGNVSKDIIKGLNDLQIKVTTTP